MPKSRFIGGKNRTGVLQTLINQIPPHDVYVELFLGSGAILRNKRPAPLMNIGVEIDPQIVAQWEADGAGNIVIEGDAVEFLVNWKDRWQTERVFVYADPPYLRSTRRTKDRYYRFEFWTPEEHARLLDAITTLPSNWMVAISGYDNPQYDQALKGWRRLDYQQHLRRKIVSIESLWMNYPHPFELHDYNHLGQGFRDRERIKKKKSRWVRMLTEMPDQERYAVMHAIEEARNAWEA